MNDLITALWPLIWVVLKILAIVLPVLGAVAYLTLAERRVIGWIQCRQGPNRVGPWGLGQPIADALKLITKELIMPTQANKGFFVIAPLLVLVPSLAAWSVIPFSKTWVLANVDAGVLFLFAMTAMGAYGILLAGWSSNSKYAFFGAMRSAAQIISYEIAMGFAMVGVLLAAGSSNLGEIVAHQHGGIWHWLCVPLLPLCVVYWISAVAETNRAPFDLAEGESEIVAGFHVEYSGMFFAVFFLAEYANMLLLSMVTVLLFFGGWLSPFEGIPGLDALFAWVPGLVWLILKLGFFLFLYIWLRATLPRYRYDQLMRLGWKILIPVTLVWLTVVAGLIQIGILS